MKYKVKFLCALAVLTGMAAIPAIVSAASADDEDPHLHHRQMMLQDASYTRSVASYDIPDIPLINQHGEKVSSNELFGTEKPLIISYIFTTCATICPVLTATLASAQSELLKADRVPNIVSISIDPEEDTPVRLAAYADRFNASPNWTFLTGTVQDIVRIQRSMKVYRGSKLNHEPVTFIRSGNESPWVRLDGFTGTANLVNEYKAVISLR